MTIALFGHTGFVGSNLLASSFFDDVYNSSNAAESIGKDYDLVVFAAARAEKWRINQDPDGDMLHIKDLEALVSGISARRFVLISTVDVFRNPLDVDERTLIETEGLHPYGLHRYRLEEFVREKHPGSLIVRLPGLFGPGLKKNVIFDFLHHNNLGRIHSGGNLQYYNLRRLWDDLNTALDKGLHTVHLTSAPISTVELARKVFGIEFDNRPADIVVGNYDLRTIHAEHYRGSNPYTYSREQTLEEIAEFVRVESQCR
jgi:nucleoside-diphosphate-sugar epimerase